MAAIIPNKAALVTPNNNANLTTPGSLYVGGAGNIRVDTVGGSEDVTFISVDAGTFVPIEVKKIYASGTTATNILVLWN